MRSNEFIARLIGREKTLRECVVEFLEKVSDEVAERATISELEMIRLPSIDSESRSGSSDDGLDLQVTSFWAPKGDEDRAIAVQVGVNRMASVRSNPPQTRPNEFFVRVQVLNGDGGPAAAFYANGYLETSHPVYTEKQASRLVRRLCATDCAGDIADVVIGLPESVDRPSSDTVTASRRQSRDAAKA